VGRPAAGVKGFVVQGLNFGVHLEHLEHGKIGVIQRIISVDTGWPAEASYTAKNTSAKIDRMITR